MKIKVIKDTFAVCKVKDLSKVNYEDEFCFVGKTDEEVSVVCNENHIPGNATDVDKTWRAFRVEGQLDFSLIGILAKIAGILAENKISIFAVSTFNTDYILTKAESFEKALEVLEASGYKILR